jgi:hypothetical protein
MRREFSQALASLKSAVDMFWVGAVAMTLLAVGMMGWLVYELVFSWLDILD